MAKKFDEISPRGISEQKFQELLDALPSSNLQSADQKPSREDIPKDSLIIPAVESSSPLKENLDPRKDLVDENLPDEFSSETLIGTQDIFVYEIQNIRFGIPVSNVTEITNDYGPISKLEGVIKACIGTFKYRGRLLPLFDSSRAYLREKVGNFDIHSNNFTNEFSNSRSTSLVSIITVEYDGVMFALSMQNHVGIVSVDLGNKTKNIKVNEMDIEEEFVHQIVWYEKKNLFIFSPKKIATIVSRELGEQIVADIEEGKQLLSHENVEIDNAIKEFMIAKVKETRIAIEITNVLEVIEGFEVTQLYKVSEFLRGLINLRGQVLACLDLSRYLGYELIVIDERNKFIVLNEAGADFALCVDEILGIRSLDNSMDQDTEKVFPSEIARFFPSFIELDKEITFFMKPELLIGSSELNEHRRIELL